MSNQNVSRRLLLLALVAVWTATFSSPGLAQDEAKSEEAAAGKLYELRFYTCNPGKLPDLHARFRDHTLKLFEKHGIENIIYWDVAEGTEADGDDASNMMIYIIAHKDESSRAASWEGFMNDPDWKSALQKSEENGKILAKPPRAILMHATDFSPGDEAPNAASDQPPRLWELRQYNDGPERVPATAERFGWGEKELFTDAGMETISFWTADDQSAFIYLLAHKDREASKASWQKFMGSFRDFMAKYREAHPNLPGGRGNGMEVRFLTPTDYSPRR